VVREFLAGKSLILFLIINTWLLIPDCFCQWQQVGPPGGCIISLASCGSYVFAGSAFSGLFRSTDYGQTWMQTNFIYQCVSAVTVATSNLGDTTVIAGTSTTGGTPTNGLWRSTDKGSTWAMTLSGPPGFTIFALAFSAPYIYASANSSGNGLYISSDDGISWAHSPQGPQYPANALAASGKNIFAAGDFGVWVSTNFGQTWAHTLSINSTIFYSLAVSGNIVFAGASAVNSNSVYLSTDNGMTWNPTSLANQYINALAFGSPPDNNIYAGTEFHGVFKSSDRGQTWVQTSLNYNGITVLTVLCLPGRVLAGTYEWGVSQSTDNGVTWNQLPIYAQVVSSLAQSAGSGPASLKLWAGSLESLYWSPDEGSTWSRYPLFDGVGADALLVLGQQRVLAANGAGVTISNDNGETWFYHPMFGGRESLAAAGGWLYAGSLDDVLGRSSDSGTTWSFDSQAPEGCASIGADSSYVFTDFLRSTDYGVTWQDFQGATGGATVIYPTGRNRVVYEAGREDGGVVRSTNNGVNWVQTTLYKSVFALAAGNGYLFAGTDTFGVYISPDGGFTWTQWNEGMTGTMNIRSLLVTDEYVYAGTLGNSSFRRHVSDLTGIRKIGQQMPERFFLGQNYPNPFNPKTVISYELAANTYVSLKIYDAVGKEVAALVEGDEKIGRHNIEWDAANFASGVYFYRLQAGSFIDTKKLVLLK